MNLKTSTLTFMVIFAMLVLTGCEGVTTQKTVGNNAPQVAAVTQTPAVVATTSSSAVPATGISLSTYETTLENIYTQVNPSVVNIRVIESGQSSQITPNSPNGSPFFGFPGIPGSPNQGQAQPSEALGSGFVWDKQGDIVTNKHVVAGVSKIDVTFYDNTTVSAKVVGTDVNSDLAVIKVGVAANELSPVILADSKQVRVGQIAIAIGNPFGLQGTMTQGIISGLGRSLPVGEGATTVPTYQIPDIIQTDAPINPGNSGGVLVDDLGHVVGVTSAIESPVQANSGIGFVIPSAIVQKVVPALIKSGHYDWPYLGITGATLNPDLAQAMNLDQQQRGALVVNVVPGGPADRAGLHGSDRQVTINGQNEVVGGDVITAIQGQQMNSMDDVIAYVANNTQIGQKVALTMLRSGKSMMIDLTLGARPSQNQGQGASNGNTTTTSGQVFLGILGISLTPEIAQAMNLPSNQQGVLVEQVESGSPADAAGLNGSFKPMTLNGQQIQIGGDIIIAVDNQPITQMNDLQSALLQDQPGQQITLSIIRDGSHEDISVTLAERPTQTP
jgi:serine protease Do